MRCARCWRRARGCGSPIAIRSAPISCARRAGSASIEAVRADIADPASVAAAVAGAEAVVNLVGILKGDFRTYHVEGAANVARAAAAAGAQGAGPYLGDRRRSRNAPSAYGRSKGEGEAAVRDGLPGRDDPAPVDRLRARGRFREQVRPDGALAAAAAGDPRRLAAAAGLRRRSRPGDRRGGARSGRAWRQDLCDRRPERDDDARPQPLGRARRRPSARPVRHSGRRSPG